MLIPGYRVSAKLGTAGRCVIYRGSREEDHTPVIIKALAGEFPLPADIDSLKREYQMMKDLEAEGVAKVYSLERHHDNLALVIEDIGGEPLKNYIGSGKIDLATILSIAIKLSTAVAELHQRNIVHKDINPQNIAVNLKSRQVKLFDFSLATNLPQESEGSRHPGLLEGTLAYISPEQTGRMNRAIDYRSDFYSLGVTFYELLTGRLPFFSDDHLELIHSHIAKTPIPPSELNSEIPQPVSDIVTKLLAKNAEDRYQSAHGLKADLAACLAQWQANGAIKGLILGEHDFSDKFRIPQKLYGREHEIKTLMNAFDRVSRGATEIMVVSGYSGIGKSALVNEVHKPVVRQRGYFISGKFDQFKRNIPYSSLVQAFQQLVRQLLTENEAQIAGWRTMLHEAVGANGQVIIDVIPEVERIIGPQPAVLQLPPLESQNRFNSLFARFLQVFTRKEHPLVIFLDDLQWADSATLKLLQTLLAPPAIPYLFVIVAYRDNEVSAGHPLLLTLAEIESGAANTGSISLQPLSIDDLNQFIADALLCEPGVAMPLSELILLKTGGNPFFVTQFLKSLRQDDLLTFDYRDHEWRFDLERVHDRGMTDNVVTLMASKIQKLSEPAQGVIRLAACIGNRFDLHTLALVSEKSPSKTADDLGQVLHEGLVVPLGKSYEFVADEVRSDEVAGASYRFLHDRVQQAAYGLLHDDEKQATHLKVGRLLFQHCDQTEREERLFDIVNQLNFGAALIDGSDERLRLAALNLAAGRKAKSQAAFQAALKFFDAGVSLLDESRWQYDYELAFPLNLEAAQCEYLCGNFDEAEREFASLLGRAATSLDKAKVYSLRIIQYENMSRYADALASAREVLGLFGVSLPDSVEDKQVALEAEINSIQSLIGRRRIDSLIDLPAMTDPEIRMVMSILTDIWSSAYILGDAILARLISATMVRLSLLHGNSEESAYGYVTHAITVGPVREDYKLAYEFGRLALKVNERFNDSRRRAKIYQQFHAHVNLWRQPMQTCIPYAQEACRSGLESGDFLYAAYGASTESWPAIVSSQDLAQFVRHFTPNLELIKKLKITSFADCLKMIMNWALALQGETESPLSLSNEEFDENEYVETYRDNPFFTMFHAIVKLHLFFVFGEHRKALETVLAVRGIVHQLTGMIWSVLFDFWNGLTLAANYADATVEERKAYLEEMEKAQRSLAVLAENCPENFLCQSLLLSAEIERISGRPLAAINFYERAINYAEDTGMIQHQALANELYAQFWRERNQAKAASIFIAHARSAYARWGAAAKVKHLDSAYKPSRATDSAGMPAIASSVAAIDLTTVIKAAQAISGEIVLEKLLQKLMRIAVENAGAVMGSLVLEKNGQWTVEAQCLAAEDEVTVLRGIPLESSQQLSAAMINYVRRYGEPLVIDDAENDGRFANDPYVVRTRPKSILCIPILSQTKTVGILYLENNLAREAFTPDRIVVMQILASQIAISIENAHLYVDMKQEIAERKRAEQQIREQAMLLDKAHDAIGVRDLEGRIIYWNKGAEQLFGWKAEEILGKRAPDILYNDPALSDELAQKVRETGNWSGELQLRTKSDAEVIVHSRWTLVRGTDGRPKSILVISTDITEKKRMEKSFLRAQRMESVGTLAGGMAHDLNNVLTPIMLAVETLQANPKSKHHRQMLDMIRTNAKRGADMAALVLAFARGVESDRAKLNPKHLISEITKIARETFPRSIDTRTETARKLWAFSGNATQMHQVMLNLMLNARDAMPDGGTLTLSAENVVLDEKDPRMPPDVAGPYIILGVRDTGSGIPSDIIDKVFDPFFTTKEVGRGTGLGLSTVAGIVKSHGGFVNVQSEPGKGAEFRVYLPALQSSEKRHGAKKREAPRGNDELILVVDDESPIREVAKAALEANGYRVITAGDGTEALALYAKQSHQIQAVLTDLMMPYMDGGATIRALEKMNPQVKIIVSSGLPAKPRSRGAKNLGSKAFIAKPYTVATLLTTLHNVLKRK